MESLDVNRRIRIPLDEFEFRFVRSSGPGGQNVNKVNSKAVLRWKVAASASLPGDVRERFVQRFASRLTREGDLIIQSDRYRDQGRNVSDCLARLRAMLADAARPPVRRKATRPGRGATEARLQQKQRHAAKKQARTTRDWTD